MKILQTFDNLDYELTEKQAEQIMEQSTLGKTGGIWIGTNYIAFASIKAIVEGREAQQNYPALPGRGFTGVISQAKRKSALTALATGIKKAIAKMNGPTPKALQLLQFARERYKLAK